MKAGIMLDLAEIALVGVLIGATAWRGLDIVTTLDRVPAHAGSNIAQEDRAEGWGSSSRVQEVGGGLCNPFPVETAVPAPFRRPARLVLPAFAGGG